ncbi:hypothetical protein BDN67DRAFT_974499 [Paxillus ammoniavirescens]|nr:hypothetical protein BDN67DRAFT_974499 [Paxillus ammoniavirescens]
MKLLLFISVLYELSASLAIVSTTRQLNLGVVVPGEWASCPYPTRARTGRLTGDSMRTWVNLTSVQNDIIPDPTRHLEGTQAIP